MLLSRQCLLPQAALDAKEKASRHWYDDWQDSAQQGLGNFLESTGQVIDYNRANRDAEKGKATPYDDLTSKPGSNAAGYDLLNAIGSKISPALQSAGADLVENNQVDNGLTPEEFASRSLGQNVKDSKAWTKYILPSMPTSIGSMAPAL